ncbi:hypothetical protein [Burkholderia ubonensis]|uniref:hypothetical protein n=1 Tax=Burkholderia ubonensis TaxID=101571 RepID=UPI0012F85C72|nr:hypothetical protein [Burkholderia ubonensis]
MNADRCGVHESTAPRIAVRQKNAAAQNERPFVEAVKMDVAFRARMAAIDEFSGIAIDDVTPVEDDASARARRRAHRARASRAARRSCR